ncbi:MAG: hypothetical protein LDLANPLL_00624 [Turneriella sp.]|nr:hypothetical protein [Turneriella sp.]
MSSILHFDAWLLGVCFFGLMLFAWWLGTYTRAMFKNENADKSSRIEDAGIALFALLLAFCFSGAANRYEDRKGYLREEAIAIGDFAATASMLDKEHSEKIRLELVKYVKSRLAFGKVHIDDPRMQEVTRDSRTSQDKIAAVLREIIHSKASPTLHTPLMNGFNGMTMTHDKALYGSMNQIADTIILLLVAFGMISSFMIGRLAADRKLSWLSLARISVYILLVTAVFTVTMDLEQPHRGMMRNSKAPLTDLLSSLEK